MISLCCSSSLNLCTNWIKFLLHQFFVSGSTNLVRFFFSRFIVKINIVLLDDSIELETMSW